MTDINSQMLHDADDEHSRMLAEPGFRARELALLARATVALLEQGLSAWPIPEWSWLRQPQTGLMMLRGRTGGDGALFNLGELPVTRCALRLVASGSQTCVGVGYVMGRSVRHAQLVAQYDALLQTAFRHARGNAILDAIAQTVAQQQAQIAQRAQATKVEFFTVAREASA